MRRHFLQLTPDEQDETLRKRLKSFSLRAYKKSHEVVEEDRDATVCQRENSFYVDTVRAFRDRRYEYKGLLKTWKGNLDRADSLEQTLKVSFLSSLLYRGEVFVL